MKYMFFPAYELACKCGKCGRGEAHMDPTFMARLVKMRIDAGFPFPLNSAYRCPNHNEAVSSSGSRNGPHTTGRAVDIRCSHEAATWIDTNAREYGFTGKGVMQRSDPARRFIHLDDLSGTPERPRPHIWSY